MAINLVAGDCVDLLRTIPDSSIDAVITDPPYGTNDDKGKNIKRGDINTSFGVLEWDKELSLEYIKQLVRIMDDDTWGFIFTDKAAISLLWNALEKNGLSPRNTFYWIKYNKAPTPRANFKSCVESAVAFTKGRTTIKWNGGGNTPNYFTTPFVINPLHPTQKPVSLITKLVMLVTDKGDTVIDPFMGSGTTGVSCVTTERNFIGFEIDESYFAIAKNRIEETQMQPRLL